MKGNLSLILQAIRFLKMNTTNSTSYNSVSKNEYPTSEERRADWVGAWTDVDFKIFETLVRTTAYVYKGKMLLSLKCKLYTLSHVIHVTYGKWHFYTNFYLELLSMSKFHIVWLVCVFM